MRHYTVALAAACLLHPAFAVAAAPQGSAAPPAAQGAPQPERKEVKVPEKVLKTYVGEYQFEQGMLAITLEDGSLWGQPEGNPKRQLHAETPTKFFLKEAPFNLEFVKDAKGVVTALKMGREGQPVREGKKVK